MERWWKLTMPRKEVREGRSFNPDEFAIALEQVVAGTAPGDYQKPGKYVAFAHAAEQKRSALRELLADGTAVGYGAAAKANTLLNVCELDLRDIVDDNPLKWGYLTPGRDIPIVEPRRVASESGDLLNEVAGTWDTISRGCNAAVPTGPATLPTAAAACKPATSRWQDDGGPPACRSSRVNELLGSVAVLFGFAVAVVGIGYLIVVYNDLARRVERLKGLQADLQTMQSRRERVGSSVSQRVGGAMRHECRLRQPGVDRRGRGRTPLIAGNANGLPNRSVGAAQQGLSEDARSLDVESQAYVQLHREAEDFNALLRQIPVCLIAPIMGFRPWRTQSRLGRAFARRRP